MVQIATLAGLAAILPAVIACNGYTGGLPTPTSTKTNSKVIEVKAGQVYDGLWAKWDRGSGACSGQTEGGKSITKNHSSPPPNDF
jgi:hypothetical protein